MNISHLRSFVAVVENDSFSQAARALNVSQPAVTMQIQSLEADIGATLLDRQYRKVELTEAGTLLLPVARSVIASIEQVRDDIAGLSGTVTGRLTIAASTTPGQYILPRLVGRFIQDHPEVGVSIVIEDTAGVVDSIERGETSFGMTGAEIKGAKVGFEQVSTDELALVCPLGHPLAQMETTDIQEIAEEPFIMREAGSGTRIVTEEVLRRAGVEPEDLNVVTEFGSSEAIVNAVEGGMGIGVVSRWVLEKALELETVAEVRSGYFPVRRPLFAVTPRGSMTRAADAFLDFLREELRVVEKGEAAE